MGLYNILIRPFVRKMDMEKASGVGIRYFSLIGKLPCGRLFNRWIHGNKPEGLQREVFGLYFYNPVGLGAGLDRYGELYNDLSDLGFSFVEIGPIGTKDISRAIRNVQNDPQRDILALCIDEDHFNAFSLAYDFFDLFVIDLGANPNADVLDRILEARIAEQNYKPVVVKLPDNITNSDLENMIGYCLMNGVDGIELRTTELVRRTASYSNGKLPIIANCHIDTPEQALEALAAGASLVEIRTGLLREGPGIVRQTLDYLLENRQTFDKDGSTI